MVSCPGLAKGRAEKMVEANKAVERWLLDAVIGLKLCPFASSVFEQGKIRISCSQASDPGEAIQFALGEVRYLLEHSEEEVSTTLVVFENALTDFRVFLDMVATLEEQLAEAGAQGIFQVATFHPAYQFAGTGKEEIENFTNRAPYPIVHLLRESQVTEAVESHPDPEGIPERNIQRLRAMGKEAIASLWSGFSS